MTHFYDDTDSDCFGCDSCDSEIIGLPYKKNGEQFSSRSKARSKDLHYCEDCSIAISENGGEE
jgi:hypothetical protein